MSCGLPMYETRMQKCTCIYKTCMADWNKVSSTSGMDATFQDCEHLRGHGSVTFQY